MITLSTTNRITLRSRSMSIGGSNTIQTDIIFDTNKDYVPIVQERKLTFLGINTMTGKRVTPPILYQLIANLCINILVKYKDKHYILGKNMIFTYDIQTQKATPLMLHVIKTNAKTIREGRIVMNPDMFQIDSSFYKLFEIILKTGVDIELTKFIEEKYYLNLNLPKFGKPADRQNYVNSFKSWAFGHLIQKESI